MLSILIPNYGAGDFLALCVQSLYANTQNDFILHVVDDASGPETQDHVLKLQKEYGFKLTLFDKRKYVNPIWNMIQKEEGDYFAILNNDIKFSKYWDVSLISSLQDDDVWIANPYQTDEGCHVPYGVSARTNGLPIRGSGFMMPKRAIHNIFPIPEDLLIWFGDNWIARQVTEVHKKKSVFVSESIIHHYGSRSSNQFQSEHGLMYWVCRGDAYAYQYLTGKSNRRWIDEILSRM